MGQRVQLLPGNGGWFAAGERFEQALRRLSDGAFKVFAHACLHAHRASGELAFRRADLARCLGKSRSTLARHLSELAVEGVCTIQHAPNQHRRSRLRVRSAYWPYRRDTPSTAAATPDPGSYVGRVREAFLEPACVRGAFGPEDQRLAARWERAGLPLETVRRAINLGCVRKTCGLINEPHHTAPIRTLRYFRGLIQEVQRVQAQPAVSDSFWDYVEYSLRRFERRLPDSYFHIPF